MKLECHPSSFTADPEGCLLASSINQHLPAEVRRQHAESYETVAVHFICNPQTPTCCFCCVVAGFVPHLL